ncbi:MAG: ribonuclease R [Bacilli bacterium]|nr:ribonuclease R [Bacilli bacterium]
MREQIIELLNKENMSYSVNEISDALNLDGVDSFKELLKELNKLEEELIIYRTKKDKYMMLTNSNLRIGRLIANKKGYGFVDIEGNDDVYIASNNMNGAIHNDKVVVEITSKKGLELEGRIVRIVDRQFKQMVGEFITVNNVHTIKLDEEKIKISIIIDGNDTLGAMDGHKVLVKIGNKIGENKYKGFVVKILGHKNDPGVDILSIVNKYGINDVFSDDVMEEVHNLPDSVDAKEMEHRRDLRNKEIFTIDGDDTKDIDDAISLDILENGNYLLGVHIADVSYYVRANTKLDDEAYDRGTSVYLADRVIPMLPRKLSNGICSLNPGVDRLAMSCDMEIDVNTGKIIDYDIYESVIKSRKQMTYKCVNSILEKNIVPDGYEPFAETLKKMYDLAKIIRKFKVSRGYIDFDVDEAKIIVNEQGEAIDVVKRYHGIGENLIEDFMICANETVASHIYYMDLPFVYRVHGEPNKEKIDKFLRFVAGLGYKITGKFNKVTPKDVQSILNQLKDKKEYHILSTLLLRSMQKAVYDRNNIGHFGLASPCYTHFTSPIRRYPDTTVHRLLRTYLFEKSLSKDVIRFWNDRLPFLTEHASEKEQDSIECEREVDDMKMAEYMMKHVGEEFEGTVSGVMSFGMFVELDNLVEGLVRVDSIKGDYYTFDEEFMTLRGKKDKKGFRLGDTVKVKVTGANKEAKTVDFELI